MNVVQRLVGIALFQNPHYRCWIFSFFLPWVWYSILDLWRFFYFFFFILSGCVACWGSFYTRAGYLHPQSTLFFLPWCFVFIYNFFFSPTIISTRIFFFFHSLDSHRVISVRLKCWWNFFFFPFERWHVDTLPCTCSSLRLSAKNLLKNLF